jgi:hypothetical protein
METKPKVPRGIRNNNPLNIRKGNNWKGERPVQSDKAFEEFSSMTYGIRAGFIIIRKYMSGYNGLTEKFNTIEKIIRRWAPPTENATQRYIDQVAKESGISPRLKLSFDDKKSMCAIVSAMIHVECGQKVDMALIESGYDLV